MDPARKRPKGTPRIVPRADHELSRKDVDPDALKVLYRLHKNGYIAYLVGGSVRDLLLGRTPKDFDVGTNATPEAIRRLFRNSRIIGRRFPLVHVYFRGGKVIEVCTFRSNQPESEAGPLARDDSWGTPEEDAFRRDLTINGLFYDIDTFAVIDFVDGLRDLDEGVVRTIGDPFVRFREDPVRMIRAIRHAARIGFEIEESTWRAINELNELILDCAPARVVEEFLRELRGGSATASVRLLAESGLLARLAPPLDEYLVDLEEDDPEEAELFWTRVRILDRLSAGEDGISDAVTLSVILGAAVEHEVNEAERAGDGRADIGRVVRDALVPELQELGVPRRMIERCYHIFLAGRRLRRAARGGNIPRAFFRKSYFAESWSYVHILLESEGWTREQMDELLTKSNEEATPSRTRRRRRRRRRRGRGDAGAGGEGRHAPGPRGARR